MVYGDLGTLLLRKSKLADAEKALMAAHELLKKELAKNPNMPSFERTHAQVLRDLGFVQAATARYSLADKSYRQSLALWANDPVAMNNLAWLLATCPDAQLRNPKKAVELVTRALAFAPNPSGGWNPKNWWNTLGVAHYQAGNWQKAKEALTTSVKLNSGGGPADWYFLAMTCQQLGAEKDARMWFERAQDWMKAAQTKDEELQRFQEEAAKVLGR
jgi:tetratricopeptide (TPR) repeat protein